jgi:hypothetical protein
LVAGGEGLGVLVDGLVGEGLGWTLKAGAGAAGFEEAAVHVVDTLGAGALVEVVYVLGAEVEIFRVCFGEALFDFSEGFVGCVGLGGEGVAAALRVEAPDESGVGFPGLGCGDVLYAVAVPEAA